MENLHKTRGNQGYTFADWTSSSNNECLASRELQYQAQFKAPMMPLSHTKCFDRQSIKQSEGNFVYVVEQRTKTPGVPYGESFEIVNLYCITQETERSTRLLVTMQVHFLKSLFWESMVDKNATEGITGFFKELVSQAKQRLASAEFLSTLPSVAPDFLKTKSSDLPVAQVTDKTASDTQQQTIEQTTEPLFSRIQQSFLNSISIRNISIALFIFMTLLSLNTMSRLSRQNAVVQEISSRIQVPDSQLRTWMSEHELYGDKAGQKSTNEFKKSQLEEIGRLVDIIKEELWIQEKFVELLISHSTPTQMDERT